MSSLAASSSSSAAAVDALFPRPAALAHTLNARGELGMFVNPYNCSCVTCVNYVSGRYLPADDTRVGLVDVPATAAAPALARVPTPPPSPLPFLGRTDSVSWPGTGALSRAPANQTWTESGWVPTESVVESDGAAAAAAAAPARGFAAPLQFNVGWGLSRRAFPTPQSYDDDVMTRLLGTRSRLMDEQTHVHDGPFRSHDEMAAADAEWEELESKINAIEGVLTAFNVEFVPH